jgi:hypothetical protein
MKEAEEGNIVEPGAIYRMIMDKDKVMVFREYEYYFAVREVLDFGPMPQLRGKNTLGIAYEILHHGIKGWVESTGLCNINSFAQWSHGFVEDDAHLQALLAEKKEENIAQLPQLLKSMLYWMDEGKLDGFTLGGVKMLFGRYYEDQQFRKIQRDLSRQGYEKFADSDELLSLPKTRLYLNQF